MVLSPWRERRPSGRIEQTGQVTMMKFSVTVKCDNAAFDPDPLEELARIIRDLADRLDRGVAFGSIRDVNGNCVGSFAIHDGGAE